MRFFILTLVTGVRVFQGGIKQVRDVAKVHPATPVKVSETPCECEVRRDGPRRARECQPKQILIRVTDIYICPDPFRCPSHPQPSRPRLSDPTARLNLPFATSAPTHRDELLRVMKIRLSKARVIAGRPRWYWPLMIPPTHLTSVQFHILSLILNFCTP